MRIGPPTEEIFQNYKFKYTYFSRNNVPDFDIKVPFGDSTILRRTQVSFCCYIPVLGNEKAKEKRQGERNRRKSIIR